MSIQKRVIKLARMAQTHRGDSDDLKIMKQIADNEHLMDRDRNPRKSLHLDTTKLSLHRDRVEALARGERVAPVTIDMALTQKCSYSCISPDATVLLANNKRKKMKDVCIGDRVVSFDAGTVSESTVMAVMQTSPRKRIVSITTKYGALRCTPDHLIMTTRGWVAAGDLRHDDKISTVVAKEMVGLSSRESHEGENCNSEQSSRHIEKRAPAPIYKNEVGETFWKGAESRPHDASGEGTTSKENFGPESQWSDDGAYYHNAEVFAAETFSAHEVAQSNARQRNGSKSLQDSEREIRRAFFQTLSGEMGERKNESSANVGKKTKK